jgi:hypothetical protein
MNMIHRSSKLLLVAMLMGLGSVLAFAQHLHHSDGSYASMAFQADQGLVSRANFRFAGRTRYGVVPGG